MAESPPDPQKQIVQTVSAVLNVKEEIINQALVFKNISFTKNVEKVCEILKTQKESWKRTKELCNYFQILDPYDPKSTTNTNTSQEVGTKDQTTDESRIQEYSNDNNNTIKDKQDESVREFTGEDFALAFLELCCTSEGKSSILSIIEGIMACREKNYFVKEICFEIGEEGNGFYFDKSGRNQPTIILNKWILKRREFGVVVAGGYSHFIPVPAYILGHEIRHGRHFLQSECLGYMECSLAFCRFFNMVGPWTMLTLLASSYKKNAVEFCKNAEADLNRINLKTCQKKRFKTDISKKMNFYSH